MISKWKFLGGWVQSLEMTSIGEDRYKEKKKNLNKV